MLNHYADLRVNRDRLIRSIERLASIGEIPQGGVRRIAYSAEDIAARQLIQHWMTEAGMRVRIDSAGNIIGCYPGQNPDFPALATGSHLDTVPAGGRYDGSFGILAGLEVVQVLQEQGIQFQHSLEVIVFTDEEGSMIGSKAMSGNLVNDSGYYRRPDGTEIQDCLRTLGGNWDTIYQAKRNLQEIAAFVELHVEQGPVLESMQQSIGVVEGIVGQQRYQIVVEGTANHAGTTPMYMRVDALVAAAKIVLAVNEVAQTPGQQVATVGQFNVFPNAANVVPGRVEMSLDIRDLSNLHIATLMEQLRLRLEEIAIATHTQIYLNPCLHNEPAMAEPHIQEIIAQVCQQLRLSYTYLPSRASHDAQELARITDMGMIFVPSQAGVSHAVTEYTSPEDCVNGTTVLLHTLIRLDQYYTNLHQT